MKHFLLLTLAGLLALCVSSCEKEKEEEPTKTIAVTGVSLNKTTLSLAEGASETLTATVAPANATNKTVTWSSSDPAVATVDDSGKVTAIKKGTISIFVKLDGRTAICTVTVEAKVNVLELIHDPVFLAYCQEQMPQWDKNKDGKLSPAEAAAVTSIGMDGDGKAEEDKVASLSGIEYFTGLTSLFCTYNQLSSLDVSNNTALEYLECYYNQLTSLDVSGCTALTSLGCSGNQLTTLDLSNNTALRELYVGDLFSSLDLSAFYTTLTSLELETQRTSLDLSRFTALTYLSIIAPNLTSLDDVVLSDKTALTYLNVSNTNITSLDLSNHTALTYLSVFSNPRLTSLDVSGCTSLTNFSSYGSDQLTALNVSGSLLTQLDLSTHNQLTTLDVSGCPVLFYLDVSGNQLTTLDVSGCTALKHLECQGNQLTSLDISGTALTLDNLVCYDNPGYPFGLGFKSEMAEQDFETDDASNWQTMSHNGATFTVGYTADGEGANGVGRALTVTNPVAQPMNYNTQFIVFWGPAMKEDKSYDFTIDIRADVATTIGTEAQSAPGAYMWVTENLSVTREWKTFKITNIFPDGNVVDGTKALAFDLGHTATTFYFDNFKLEEAVSGE